jgi:hypothetical protein
MSNSLDLKSFKIVYKYIRKTSRRNWDIKDGENRNCGIELCTLPYENQHRHTENKSAEN